MNPRSLPTDLRITEKTLRRLDITEPEPQIPEAEDYYQRLHDRIMAQVEDREIKPPPSPSPALSPKDLLKRHWRNGLYLVTMCALVAVIGVRNIKSINSQISENHAVAKFKNEDQLIGLIKESPDVLDNTVLSVYSSNDVLNNKLYSKIDLTKELIESL
ncbi:MAG: hypothetical protein JNL11_15250 [Bdellovibrionaceae bacterium]|nr:hypothetical protein [Pseudobdellovibrionaceae bacterium]